MFNGSISSQAPSSAYRVEPRPRVKTSGPTAYTSIRRRPERQRKYNFLFASAMFGGNTSLFESMKEMLSGRDDFDSHWLLMDEEPRELITRIPPISLNWTLKGGLSMRSRVLALERKGIRFDAAFFNHLIPAIFLREFRRRVPTFIAMDVTPPLLDRYGSWYGVPTTSKRNPLERLKRHLVSSTYTDAKYLAPFSEWAAESLRKDYDIPREKICVIPVGIDTRKWMPNRPALPAGRRPRILFVGSDFVRKGGDLLLALAQQQEFSTCDFHFLSYDDIRPKSPNVFLHSHITPNSDALRKLYLDSDIFVLPSRGDLSPVAILEAMAMELPVISTDIAGIPELVSHGTTGFLVPPDNERQLATCLRTLVRDSSLRLRFGKEARKTIEQRFNLHKCTDAIVGRLKEVADRVPHMGSTDLPFAFPSNSAHASLH